MASTSCVGTNARGEPCGAAPLQGGQYCFFHDPDNGAARKEARSKGGRARHGRKIRNTGGRVRLGSIDDVLAVLEGTLSDVLGMENSISRARVVGYLAGVALKALETSDLEQRLVRLEEKIGIR